MKIKFVMVGAAFLLILIHMSGCVEKSDIEKIIGVWQNVETDAKWRFTQDGEIKTNFTGEYVILKYQLEEGNILNTSVSSYDPSLDEWETYYYKDRYVFESDDVLILESLEVGKETVFHRIE